MDGDGLDDVALGGFHTVTLGYGRTDARGFGVVQQEICEARSVALVDLDADGLLDIVAGGGGDGRVCIRRGAPGRRFGPIEELISPVLFPHAVAAGDFNGDGAVDIAVWGRQRGDVTTHFVVYEGEGDGRYGLTEIETRALDPGGTPDMTMVAADLDRDGDDELVLLIQPLANGRDRQGKLLLVSGRAKGEFSVGSLGYVDGAWLHLADLDSDGRLDLVVSEGFLGPEADGGAATILRGVADLEFDAPCRLPLSGSAGIVASADLDGDGTTDLALPLGDRIEVVFSPLEECVPAPRCYERMEEVEVAGAGRVVVDDFTGDGGKEIVVLANGSARFLAHEQGELRALSSFPAPAVAPDAVAADLDGDGFRDLAVTDFARGSVEVYYSTGDGLRFEMPLSLAAGLLPVGIAIDDLDADGNRDVVVALSGEDRVALFLARGGRAFSEARFLAAGAEPQGIASGDLNGDGRRDIVVANAHTTWVSFIPGLEGGEFGEREELRVVEDPRRVRVLDVDRNGLDDIIAVSHDLNAVTLLFSHGDRFRPRIINLPEQSLSSALVVFDLNGDGLADVLTASPGQRSVNVFPGLGGEEFDRRGDTLFLGFGTRAEGVLSLAAGDVDGDGLEDLVIGDTAGGRVHWFRSLGCGTGSSFVRGDVDLNGGLALTDAVLLLQSLFRGGGALACEDAADANDDGGLNVTDAVYLLAYLFLSGPAPPDPFPEAGGDPTEDALGCSGV